MSESGRSHEFFEKIRCQIIDEKNIQEFREQAGLKILFLWGHQCPNCEIAKNVLADRSDELGKFSFFWADCNVYENMEVGKSFGIHGIPVFLFFQGPKLLGKVSPFPGWAPFQEVLLKIEQQNSGKN